MMRKSLFMSMLVAGSVMGYAGAYGVNGMGGSVLSH